MRVLLIGANGQLGSDLAKVLAEEELIGLTHRILDICDAEGVREKFRFYRPQIVINTAAYHKVDECEVNVERSFEVNAYGVHNLAFACKEFDCVLLHMSTDYVFDGNKRAPYIETDKPQPINVYGVSKLAGEYIVQYILDRYWLIRTSGLYGVAGSRGKGSNFVELMLSLAASKKEIRVVHDQVVSPTYTIDLARKIGELIQTEHFGVYHIANSGSCSWFEFAKKIFELCGIEATLYPTTTEEFGAMARRPSYSVLKNHALEGIGMDDMRTWDQALNAYLEARRQHNG